MGTRASALVAILGFALLGLLFADWYAFGPLAQRVYAYADPAAGSGLTGSFVAVGDLSAWATGTWTSIVVVLFATACVGQAIVRRGDGALTVAAVAVVGWIAARAIWPPDDLLQAAWGLWASLAVSVAILAVLVGAHARRIPGRRPAAAVAG